MYKETALKITGLLEEKNASYGDSIGTSAQAFKLLYPEGIKPEQYGNVLILIRIWDKMKRIAAGHSEDSWQDIAGYAIRMCRDEEKDSYKPTAEEVISHIKDHEQMLQSEPITMKDSGLVNPCAEVTYIKPSKCHFCGESTFSIINFCAVCKCKGAGTLGPISAGFYENLTPREVVGIKQYLEMGDNDFYGLLANQQLLFKQRTGSYEDLAQCQQLKTES